MDARQLIELLARGRETRQVELKESVDFSQNRVKAKIAKAVMGMANTRDGGLVILGMRELDDGQYEPVGVRRDHLVAIDQDRVSSSVMEYASPYVELTVSLVTDNEHPDLRGKTFVVMSVTEFEEIPVICKRQYQDEGLREGAVYIRSFERVETREVQTEAEMRELIDLASEKRLRKLLETTERAGGAIVQAVQKETADAQRFQEQLEDL